jgi:hypothetical protein
VRGRATRALAEAGRPHVMICNSVRPKLATADGAGRQSSVHSPVRAPARRLPAALTNGDPSGAQDVLTESSGGYPNFALRGLRGCAGTFQPKRRAMMGLYVLGVCTRSGRRNTREPPQSQQRTAPALGLACGRDAVHLLLG